MSHSPRGWLFCFMELNKYSKHVTSDPTQPAAQAMLHAIGLSKEDLLKPQVGVVSTGWEGNPCNMHLNDLAYDIKRNISLEELIPLVFHTIGVSDGISMGTAGMRYSLPSRDIIADSIETVVSAQWYDAVIAVVGCDKNMPGAMIALGRLNRPAMIYYGGTIAPGCHNNKDLTIISTFEALGEKIAGRINQDELDHIIQSACPGAGACGGMFTANTMASAIEAMGMSLPFDASNPALSDEKKQETLLAGESMMNLIKNDIKPRDIVTKSAMINAMKLITVLGGSTNAVLHMIAIGKAFDIDFTLKDIQEISNSTPYLADLKPSGKYVMQDLHKIGGIPSVMKLLLRENLIDGNCMTVTGKTMGENLEQVSHFEEGQKIIFPVDQPIKSTGHLQILKGNLATDGAVAKITGKEGLRFEGQAIVFNSEDEANVAIRNQKISEGDVIVIRYSGPKGAPGMPEMLKPTGLIMGAGLGDKVALITDGRFSGGTHGFVVGHITPEAFNGGLIGLVENGDKIIIDADQNLLQLVVDESEIERRKTLWQKPIDNPTGHLKKYRHTVSSASEGCVTDQF